MAFQQVIAAPVALTRNHMTTPLPRGSKGTFASTREATTAFDTPANAGRAELVALVKSMAAGQEQALAEFYDRTIGKAYGLALRITGNAALAEEVVADTYYQAWRHASDYDSQRAAPITWLLIMCRSRALDALRARDPAVLHEAPHDLVAPDTAQHDADTLDLLAALETGQAVRAAVATLSASERQMIALAFFRGLSHQEIAQFLGMPLGTVKSQIRRALETLRRQWPAAHQGSA